MTIEFNEISYLTDPSPDILKADHQQFLLSICGPVVIDITGKDTSRTRVITTLIHGNEPSGIIALHRYLTKRTKTKPVTNLRFVICSVEAAQATPMFSNRYLENGLDLNRCFGTSLNSGYHQRADLICKVINEVKPEVVIDIHNTSGSSPAFSVSIMKNEMALSLTSLFCHSLILSEIKLGALMEQDFGCEAITIECGGRDDTQAHETAFIGISKLALLDDIRYCHYDNDVMTYLSPLRLQLNKHVPLAYANTDEGEPGVTLVSNIEQHNFGLVHKGQMLGWLDNNGLDNLLLLNSYSDNIVEHYFTLRENQLVAKIDLHMFMATKSITIAKNDCLCYLVAHKNVM